MSYPKNQEIINNIELPDLPDIHPNTIEPILDENNKVVKVAILYDDYIEFLLFAKEIAKIKEIYNK